MEITNRILKKILRNCRRNQADLVEQAAADAILLAFPFDEQQQNIAYRVFAPVLKSPTVKSCGLIVESGNQVLANIPPEKLLLLTLPENILKEPLLDENISRQLRRFRFAVALDLNPELHPYNAAAVLQSSAAKRIGFLTEFSDHFYNIQISKKVSDPIESSYRIMLDLVRDTGLL